MKRYCWIILFVLSILVILFGISNFFTTGLVRAIDDKKVGIIYEGYKPTLGEMSDIVCDKDDYIYVAGKQADCITVFTPTGKVLYSYLFPITPNGGADLVALQNGSVVVDYPNTRDLYIFRNNMTVSKIPKPKSQHQFLYEEYDNSQVYMRPGSEVMNSKGIRISRSWITSQIYSIDKKGNKERIAGNSILQWVFSEPFPSAFWFVIGCCVFLYLVQIKEKWMS